MVKSATWASDSTVRFPLSHEFEQLEAIGVSEGFGHGGEVGQHLAFRVHA